MKAKINKALLKIFLKSKQQRDFLSKFKFQFKDVHTFPFDF